MRWQGQSVGAHVPGALPGLDANDGFVRTVRTPEFAGITFHEVLAKSALNRIPAAAQLPFEWTVNPYRRCTHACVYCFARNTHTYLDLDAGRDFDTQIVVKTNLVEVLQRELARPSWRREHVAMVTNTDPYQRAEGRYRLMPGVIRALARSGTPFSILTKGTLARRDLPLLAAASRDVPIGLGEAVITELRLIRAASLRLMRSNIMKRPALSSWKEVLEYLRAAQSWEHREQFPSLCPWSRWVHPAAKPDSLFPRSCITPGPWPRITVWNLLRFSIR